MMTSYVESFLWCAIQVTVFGIGSAIICLVVTRRDQHAAAAVIMVSLVGVAILTCLMFSPIAHWSWAATPWSTWSVRAVGKHTHPAMLAEYEASSPPAKAITSDHLVEPGPPREPTTTEFVTESASDSKSDSGTEDYPAPDVFINNYFNWQLLVACVAWALIAVGVMRLVAAFFALRRYRQSGAPLVDDELVRSAATIAQEMGISTVPTLCESAAVPGPATIGWRRPLILLPPAWREWTSDERSAVLAHELAHVHLRHFPQWLFGQFVLVSHFYHPLVHWLTRRLRLEHELAADQCAAQVLGNHSQYLAALATLALRAAPAGGANLGPGLFMSHPMLMRRIFMLRHRKTHLPANRRFTRAASLFLIFAAGLAASGIRSATVPSATADEPVNEVQPVPPQREQPPREDQKADLAPVENDATHVVTALIQASRQRSTLMGDDQQPNEERDWQIFCKTQRALLQSFPVLNSAFQEPGVAELPVLADQDEPIQWLLQRLDFDFEPNSEVLSIGMTCRESEVPQFVKIINAIAKSYVDYAVNEQRKRRLASRDSFAGALAKLNDQIYRKTEDYRESAKQIGSSDGGQENSEAKRIMADVIRASRELVALRSKLTELSIGYEIQRRQLKDPQLREQQLEQAMSADPSIAAMQQQLVLLDYQIRNLRSKARNDSSSAVNGFLKQRQVLQQEIAQFRKQIKQQMELEYDKVALHQATDTVRARAAELSQQIAALQKQISEQSDKLLALDEKSVELKIQQSELASLQTIASELAMKVESIDIELEGPPWIRVIQPAIASRSDHSAVQPHDATSIDPREQEFLEVIAGLKEKQQRLEAKLHKAQSDLEELRRSIIEGDR